MAGKTVKKAAGVEPADAHHPPAVTITAARDGFRRCGVAHPAAPTWHPAGTFTAHQIEVMMGEPLLAVIVDDDNAPPPEGDAD